MAYLEHLEEIITRKRRRLQKLEEQQAHSKLLNLFQRYQLGFAELLDRVRQDPGRGHLLEYQRRLGDHMAQARVAGDLPNGQAERTEIVREINDFAIEEIGKGFYEICGISPGARVNDLPPPAPPSSSSQPSAPPADTARPSIGSINAQNVAFGDQTIGNQITIHQYLGSEKRHQPPTQRSEQDILNQHILALGQAVKQQAAPELIEPAREQALELQRAFGAVNLIKMATVLTWFEQNLPTLATSVRAIICHQIVRCRVNAAGTEVIREFQRRFGTCNDSRSAEHE